MEDKDYDMVIGRLVRLKIWLKPTFHKTVDELIEELINDVEFK